MMEGIPGLINAIRMINSYSRYYNTSERMTALFVKVGAQETVAGHIKSSFLSADLLQSEKAIEKNGWGKRGHRRFSRYVATNLNARKRLSECWNFSFAKGRMTRFKIDKSPVRVL